ncbi:MAG: RCC1 domain-containing protein [Longimicrobiales bacterium]
MSYSSQTSATLLILTIVSSFAACSDATAPDEEFTGWTQVAVGNAHACALTNNGEAYCWGDSSDGQAGVIGGAGLLTLPTAVDTDVRFVQIEAGGRLTCGRTAEDRLFCWGDNQWGQLGNGGIADSPRPWEVEGQYSWTDVSVGHGHACAVESGGTMLCWGGDPWDMLLGYRASQTCLASPDFDGRMPCAGVPTAVDAALSFTSVKVSAGATCGGTSSGAVCWGSNRYGELGRTTTGTCATTDPRYGTRDCSRDPGSPIGQSFTTILPGSTHACGLAAGGAPYCWGALVLDMGQVGTGVDGGAAEPTPIVGLSSLDFLATSPASHIRTFTCGIQSGGTGHCWGANTEGQLGAPTTEDCGSAFPIPCSRTPVAIETSAGLQSIALGSEFACALTLDGEILCWGKNAEGQLGDGSLTTRQTPAAILSP